MGLHPVGGFAVFGVAGFAAAMGFGWITQADSSEETAAVVEVGPTSTTTEALEGAAEADAQMLGVQVEPSEGIVAGDLVEIAITGAESDELVSVLVDGVIIDQVRGPSSVTWQATVGAHSVAAESKDRSGDDGRALVDIDVGSAADDVAAGTDVTTTSSAATVDANGYITESAVAGEYVAIVWSTLTNDAGSADTLATVREMIATRQRSLGVELIAIDGNEFESLRGGTVAVAYRGGFTNARAGADWCVANGLTSGLVCFGVILSDAHHFSDRGDNVRVYP